MRQWRRRHVVRKIGDDAPGRVAHGGRVDIERVGLDDLEAPGKGVGQFADGVDLSRKVAMVFANDMPGRRVQVARPAVVTQPGPVRHHVVGWRRR